MLIPLIEFDYWGLPIYNVMGIIGFVLAALLLIRKETQKNLNPDYEMKINISFLLASLWALLLANVANWLLFPELLGYPLMERFYTGGFSFYYGMLGFTAISALLLWVQRTDFKYWINEIVPSILIFHAFGRVGCSLVGCCYGIRINETSVFGATTNLFPARELEALFLFIMFAVFQVLIKNNRLYWYLLSYAISRFFIEFGRGDPRGRLLTDVLSPAQVTSIVIVLILLSLTIMKTTKNLFEKPEITRPM